VPRRPTRTRRRLRIAQGGIVQGGIVPGGIVLLVGMIATSCARLPPEQATPAPSTGPPATRSLETLPPQTSPPETLPLETLPPETLPSAPPLGPSISVDGDAVVRLVPEIVNRFPHDPTAFTQGLELVGANLLESLGEYGRSERRLVDPATGSVVRAFALPPDLFGDGITVADGTVIQLTWREGTAYRADPATLEPAGAFTYEGEGWGLCAEPDRLVMSNGTDELVFRDLQSFEPIGSVRVTLDGESVEQLNELECVDGMVWANVWLSSDILQIDPASGAVRAVVDASSLLPPNPGSPEDVLNGIAFDTDTGTFFVTGKRWATLYEVRFVAAG
jgi:glutaminyl-peptide cyclotransferase